MTTRRSAPAKARARTTAAMLAAVLTTIAACNGDDGTLTLDTSTTAATTATSVPPPTTAAPDTTTSTTPPTTAEPTTTAAPDTTQPLDPEAQVRADFAQTLEAFYQCGADPLTCDPTDVAIAGSPAEQHLKEALELLIENNLRADLSTGPRELEIEQVAIVDRENAVVLTCITDGTWVMDIGDPDNPDDDIVFNDHLLSYRTAWQLRLSDEGWRRFTWERLALFVEEVGCDG